MPYFDTHAHLEDTQLLSNVDELMQQAAGAGLVGVTAIGTTVATSEKCVQLAERFSNLASGDAPSSSSKSAARRKAASDGHSPKIYAAVGIHPNNAHQATSTDWSVIEHLAQHDHAVALGETGLDLHWDDCPFEIQQQFFARHIGLSHETGMPLVIHMRDCETEMLEFLKSQLRDGKINGIMHSFCGSWETAQQCLQWGMYISFAGMVTFKKSDQLRAVAAKIPDDRLLIETDSPYLTPHPHRSKRPNHPAMVVHTAACLADVRGVSVDTLGKLTTENAHQVFNLD